MNKNNFLDQNKNYRAEFGHIFRSSGIFYIPKNIKTILSISNYWKFKNSKNVTLLISERKLDGKLVRRRQMSFIERNVINISDFLIKEGSVEVEAFSSSNIKIPYAAIMVVYDAKDSVSMMHTYGRNHSLIELEDNNSITSAKESCWTIKPKFINSAIFHNGHIPTNSQIGKLILTNFKNKDKIYNFKIPKLKPFQTFKFELSKIAPNFRKHLNNKKGFGTLHFKNKSSFTRLLIVWSDKKNKNFQVTHSNFDYSKYITNKNYSLKGAEMPIVKFNEKLETRELIIYPKFEKNEFKLNLDDSIYDKKVCSGKIIKINKDIERATFKTRNKIIPSRLVTALSGQIKNQKIPFECSLGVVHEKTAKKRFSWALISHKYRTYVHLNFNNVLNPESKFNLIFNIFNSKNLLIKKKTIEINRNNLSTPIVYELNDIFPEYKKFLSGEYGYISLFTTNNAVRMLTSLYSNKKGITLEHAF